VAGEAARALAARQVVDKRSASSVRKLRDHLVSEHRAGRRAPELLDVRSAQPAGQDADGLAAAVRLGHLGERGLPGRV
jgi:hypothetical protein